MRCYPRSDRQRLGRCRTFDANFRTHLVVLKIPLQKGLKDSSKVAFDLRSLAKAKFSKIASIPSPYPINH